MVDASGEQSFDNYLENTPQSMNRETVRSPS